MKGRESGMPDEDLWTGFFDPDEVVSRLGCTGRSGDVVEFGCGYGTFTFPVASVLAGTIHALDIDPQMVGWVERKARDDGQTNIRAAERDFMATGTGLESGSMVHAMVFNILHIEEPGKLLGEAWRILAPGGVASVIHWRSDIPTPRGPSLDIRPSPDQCRRWAEEAGFRSVREIALGEAAPWHFGLLLEK
jgi:SAM-dependent methyltransferase